MEELRPRNRRRPQRDVDAHQWARVLREEPPRPVLGHQQRIRLAGLLVQALSLEEPDSLIEDADYRDAPVTWLPDFRPAPGFRWTELEAVDWALCWSNPIDEAEQFYEDRLDDWWNGSRYTVERLEITPDQVAFSLVRDWEYDSNRYSVIISAGWIQVATEDTGWLLLHIAQSLTGWIAMTRDGFVVQEPVRCADCGHFYVLDGQDFEGCPRCGSMQIYVGWEVEPPPISLPDEAIAMTALLIEGGFITLAGYPGDVEQVVRRALGASQQRAALVEALLSCDAVEEVYASDGLLDSLIFHW